MDKRQGMMAALAVVVVVVAAAAWWLMQQGGGATPDVVSAPKVLPKPPAAATTAPASAPGAAAPAGATAAKPAGHAEPDALALSEEEIDRVNQEKDDLAARAADLQSQVEDGKMILDMKAKQIKELEAQLKAQKPGKK